MADMAKPEEVSTGVAVILNPNIRFWDSRARLLVCGHALLTPVRSWPIPPCRHSWQLLGGLSTGVFSHAFERPVNEPA